MSGTRPTVLGGLASFGGGGPFKQFFSEDGDRLRRLYSHAHDSTVFVRKPDSDFDVVAYNNGFARTSGHNQHSPYSCIPWRPWRAFSYLLRAILLPELLTLLASGATFKPLESITRQREGSHVYL